MRHENLPSPRLVSRCLLFAAALVIYPSVGEAQTALPPIVVPPGQAASNIELNKIQTASGNSGNGSVNLSEFNKVKLDLIAAFCPQPIECTIHNGPGFGRHTSSSRAQMYRDFCVPNPGENSCDSGAASNPPEDVLGTVSFSAQRIWQFLTLASGTASLKVYAEIIDLDNANKRVGYQSLDDESQGSFLGQIKTIAKVPVPVPEFDGEQVMRPVVIPFRLRRGHQHRLILTMAATTDSGIRATGFAQIKMDGNLVGGHSGGIQVSDLSVSVSSSDDDRITALENRVTALEEAVANAPDADEAQSASFDQKVDGLSGGVNDLALDVENVKAQMQSAQGALAAAIQSTQTSLSAALQAAQTDIAGVQAQVGGLETRVATLQIKMDGHTHDCVLLRPGHDDAKDRDRRGAKDDRPGFGGQFTISCAAPKQPTPPAKTKKK